MINFFKLRLINFLVVFRSLCYLYKVNIKSIVRKDNNIYMYCVFIRFVKKVICEYYRVKWCVIFYVIFVLVLIYFNVKINVKLIVFSIEM